jgi:hypothetical protein
MTKKCALISAFFIVLFSQAAIQPANAGSAVVSNGKFTNVYVYPDPNRETWEQHIARLRRDFGFFTRASIDHFTATMMQPIWPSYWDALFQYNQINPPRFFGSFVASQSCVDAAIKDEHNGVIQWDTVRSLSNCHIDGMDPSPQVNLIFSPDLKVAPIVPFGTGPDMCSVPGGDVAWHAWGINTPNFAALPTSTSCASSFSQFTGSLTHEDVEIVSDPAGAGMGTIGHNELADNCENRPDRFTTFFGFTVSRYWSNFDNTCLPKLDPPPGSVATTWLLGQGSPLQRFTGSVHTLALGVPSARVVTNAPVTQAQIVIKTGGDDLRGGSNAGDNATVTLNYAGGGTATTANVNAGRSWENGETHAVILNLLPGKLVSQISGATITTHFGGGIGGDNWNVDKVALIVSFASGSTTVTPTPIVVHQWLDVSGGPLIRFTGSVHDLSIPVASQDSGKAVQALSLIVSTGNDDLRGGGNPGDNCDVTLALTGGRTIVMHNINGGGDWGNWSVHTVAVPLGGSGLVGGDLTSLHLHTGFGGGLGGDNWNVQRVQLEATL